MTDIQEKKVDIASPEMQSAFIRVQRSSLITNIMMVLLTLVSAGLAVWVAVEQARMKFTDWSVTAFMVLLCGYALFFGSILLSELLILKPYRLNMKRFVAEAYGEGNVLKAAGNVELELMLIGDVLTLMRRGSTDFVRIDMYPIRNYTGVCAYVNRLAKTYIKDYYFVNAEKLGVTKVALYDKVSGKEKVNVVLSPEKKPMDRSKSWFVKNGIVNTMG